MLLLIAFTVVAGTLFLQGLTLPWLARRLRVPGPDALEDALARLPCMGGVTYLGSLYVPTDEACLCRFEAADAQSVHDVNVLAGLPFARIVVCTDIGPTHSGHAHEREPS